jgi:hypothetical protein
MRNRNALRVVAILGLLVWPLVGQVDQGQISGEVRDASNLPVAGAEVVAVSSEGGSRRSSRTSGNGSFLFTNLPVGHYDVSVEAPGFRKYVSSRVKVDAAMRTSMSVQLEVGSVNETVTVTAPVALLQRETAVLGRTIEARQITDLALNGRNPINLALMKAGVIGGNFNRFAPDSVDENRFSINGSPATGAVITVDGVNAVRSRSATATIGVLNVDSLQEVQILTANFPAEYGRGDGGQVRFVTRSGTRDFHGTLFHFFRNSALDANSWVRNQSTNRDESRRPAPLRFNQPGFSIGGPVMIPGYFNPGRDRLFFFFAQEYIRFQRDLTSTGTVPTVRMRNGDMSELLDPANPFYRSARVIQDARAGAPFPNNIIPPSRVSPNGAGLLRAYPLPTPGFQVGAANWIRTLPAPRNSRKDAVRIDLHTRAHRLSFTGQNFSFDYTEPFRGFDRVGTVWDRPNRTGSLSLTSTLSPKFINELTLAAGIDVYRIDNLESSPYRRSLAGIDYPYLFPGTKEVEDKIPTVQVTGLTTLDGGPYPAKGSGPQYSFSDVATWLPSAKHTFKFGFFFERAGHNNFDQIFAGTGLPGATNNQNGKFEIFPTGHPLTSGEAISNTALGFFNSYGEIGRRAYTLLRSHAYEAFFQDAWRIRSRLTLELGVRYAYYQPWYALWNDLANFDPRFYDPAKRAEVHPTGGFIVSGDAYNGVVLPGNGYPVSARGRIPAEEVPGVERLFRGLPRGFVNDYKDQFSPRTGFAYQLGSKTVVRGGAGVYQARTMFWSTYLFGNAPNQVTVGVTNGFIDNPAGGSTRRDFPFQMRALDRDYRYPTAYTYSLAIQRELPGQIVLETAYVGKKSVNLRRDRNVNQLPVGTLQQNPGRNPDSLRPWHGLGITTYGEYTGQSNFNSLQVSADRRFHKGLAFGVAYTFSKLIDNTLQPYDAYNTNLVKAVSALDRTHLLNVSFIYELPFGKGQRGFTGTALGGWQLSGVNFFRSGQPLSVRDSVDIAGVGPGSGPQPWNLVGNPAVSGKRGLGTQWFNPLAFALPAPGSFGNAGMNILRGPAYQNWDLALFKNFRLREDKLQAQFRVEVFNFPNHPVLSNPDVNPRSGFFGLVTRKEGERNLQLGIKLIF